MGNIEIGVCKGCGCRISNERIRFFGYWGERDKKTLCLKMKSLLLFQKCNFDWKVHIISKVNLLLLKSFRKAAIAENVKLAMYH